MTSPFDRRRQRSGWSRTALAAENDRLRARLAAACAELETAEARERARMADDLHDILGHTFEVVAFKAELADRLLNTDLSRARLEMTDVQRTVRSAMSEVRALARCRQPTDLEVELAGAVSLFRSAGIQVTVFGDARAISPTARDPLARTVREAVTNVLRHAVPTQCLITLEQNSSEASLLLVNDGADAAPARVRSGGTGLARLSRLLAEHGGRLSAEHESGRFTLRATVAIAASTSGAALPAPVPHPRRSAAGQLPLPQ